MAKRYRRFGLPLVFLCFSHNTRAQEPMEVWSGLCQAAGAISPVIKGFCTVTDKLYSIAKGSDPSVKGIYLQLTSLEIDVKELEGRVADLSYAERRLEVLDLARAVDEQRAQVEAALQTAADHPADVAPQTQALAAAKALAKPTFYSMPGHTVGSPDRFDPRAALPSFVMAVQSWIAIREGAHASWTGPSRQDLAGFAARLKEIAAQMRTSLSCQEIWQTFERVACENRPVPKITTPRQPEAPPKAACGTEQACSHRLSCTDKMQDETNATGKTVSGACSSRSTINAQQNYARRVADYGIATYEDIARMWAGRANRNRAPATTPVQ